MAEDFSTTLCGVGECGSCLFSWFCNPCALAQARSNLDDSSCCFNFFCVSPVATRWMIRTAYGIPGDGCNDCMTALFCPCCSVNQLYQTTKTKKNPTSDGGRSFNTNPFESKLGSGDCGAGCYACCCMPCFVGTTLERSVGMPFCMGCMCTNLCVARNMIRYHYRIRGEDMQEECLTPFFTYVCGSLIAQFIPCIWCCILPAIVAYGVQLSSEADKKGSGKFGRYLSGYVVERPAVAQQPVIMQPGHPSYGNTPPPNQPQQSPHIPHVVYAEAVVMHEQPPPMASVHASAPPPPYEQPPSAPDGIDKSEYR